MGCWRCQTTQYPSKESTLKLKPSSRRSKPVIAVDGVGIASHAGSAALTELADTLGWTRALSELGRRWYVDELFLCRGGKKHYLYRAVDQRGQVVDVLMRERRDLASAEAFFRRAVKRWVLEPNQMVSDHHQPYVKAVKGVLPGATHIRTGLHRRRGETTKSIERSHIAIRDRLRCSRGLKSVTAGQRFLEGFEAMRALSRGKVLLTHLVPGYRPTLATDQQRVRAVVAAMHVLGARLTKAA